MKGKLLLTLLSFVILISCKKKPIKPDPEYPDLPEYSEKGLGVGGLLINDKPWLTLQPALFGSIRPFQLFSYPNGDSVVIFFNGHYKDSSIRYQTPQTIFVVIKNLKIVTDNDLIQLNGKSFSLDGNINYGGFSEDHGYSKEGKAVGSITFGKVSENSRITYGDGSPNNPVSHPYIVAGRFEMNYFTTSNYALKYGRFDFYITSGGKQFVIVQ
jgi:hypothetical protein